MGFMCQFNIPGVCDGTDRANERGEMEVLKEMILSSFDDNDQGSAVVEWKEAERNLKEKLVSCNSG